MLWTGMSVEQYYYSSVDELNNNITTLGYRIVYMNAQSIRNKTDTVTLFT